VQHQEAPVNKGQSNRCTETERCVRTYYHHQNSVGDLDDSGAEGKRRSTHHRPAILHHADKVWINKEEGIEKDLERGQRERL
jgi:hypothetical protein